MTTSQGTEGVGRASTRSVVLSSVAADRGQCRTGAADLPALPRDGVVHMSDAAIRFEAVTKSFGDRRVLDDVSFEIPRATAFCLLGRSGTGKSVTLRHIIGLMRPDSGRVFVNDDEVSTLDSRGLSRMRQGMGFLFQNAALFDSLTVGENVAFPLRRHQRHLSDAAIRQAARDKLAQVGLEQDYDKMPADLSGGMRKRAGLARAMALGPRLLLVDEPSAGLDPITAGEIDRAARRSEASTGNDARGRHPQHPECPRHWRRAGASRRRQDCRARNRRHARREHGSAGPCLHALGGIWIMPSARLIGVGVFVVGGFLLFALGLFMIGDRRSLFADLFVVNAEFAQVAGLA